MRCRSAGIVQQIWVEIGPDPYLSRSVFGREAEAVESRQPLSHRQVGRLHPLPRTWRVNADPREDFRRKLGGALAERRRLSVDCVQVHFDTTLSLITSGEVTRTGAEFDGLRSRYPFVNDVIFPQMSG